MFTGESQIEVNMVLLWRDQITIHYLAVGSWPLSVTKFVFTIQSLMAYTTNTDDSYCFVCFHVVNRVLYLKNSQ